jgi:CBS domain-containing protein
MPEHPTQELVVAIAGPLVNVVIAAAIWLGLGVATRFSPNLQLDNPNLPMLLQIRNVNIWLVIFNLIPAFPMDGGRILRAILATRMNYSRATNVAASIGQFLAFVFGFIGLFGNPMLIFIALFVYMGAAQEAAFTQMRELARHSAVADAMVTDFQSLPLEATLGDAADALLRTHQREFPVVDPAGKVVGLLTREDLIAGLKLTGPAAPIATAMKPDVPTIGVDSSLEEAFQMMNEGGIPAVMVVGSRGQPAGMITPENVGELMMIRSALEGVARPPWFKSRDAAARADLRPVAPA